jgi:uncharacterized cupredoxin-like copper-binding protein
MNIPRMLLLAGAAVALAACTPAEQTAEDTARLEAAPGDTAPAAAAARTVHVVLNEWGVTPSESAVDAGPIRFHAMNEGQHPHSLEIERDGQQWSIPRIEAGGTGEVTANLTAGTYTLYCPIVDGQGNHRQRGMQATFTVR